MKRIIYLILLTSSTLISQTELNNFEIESDNNIVYKRVFDNKGKSKEDIISFFKSLSNVNIKKTSDYLEGNIKDMNINYKKYGGKYMNTLILLNQKMNSKIKIQFKENNYRVILRDMKFYDDVSLYSTTTLKESDNITHFSDFMVKKKKGQLRKSKTLRKGLEYMDKHFKDVFTYNKSDSDNDW
jgi:hypothetical protein